MRVMGYPVQGHIYKFIFANFHRPLGQLKPFPTGCASIVEVRSLWRSLVKTYCLAVKNVAMGESEAAEQV